MDRGQAKSEARRHRCIDLALDRSMGVITKPWPMYRREITSSSAKGVRHSHKRITLHRVSPSSRNRNTQTQTQPGKVKMRERLNEPVPSPYSDSGGFDLRPNPSASSVPDQDEHASFVR